MCCTPDSVLNCVFLGKVDYLAHNTFKLIFWASKRFRVHNEANVFCSVIYLLRLTFSLGKIVQIHNMGKIVSPFFLNSLVRYIYGHDPQTKFLIFALEKNDRKNIL